MRFRSGFTAGAIMIAAMLCAKTSPALAGVSDAWAWKHRVLVVFAKDADDPALTDQRRQLSRFEPGLLDRDMAVIEVVGGAAKTCIGPDLKLTGPALVSYARKSGNAFEVMLFGKDTGMKLRSGKPVTANDLFTLIDKMPMRRQEMRNGS
eukprot:g909.t1